MAHGVIVPQFWNDERLTPLDYAARLMAAFLITGRPSLDVPGLINAGPGAIAEESGIDPFHVPVALAQLEAAEFLEMDKLRRMIRVPKAPNYVPRPNVNMVRAWFRRWNLLPESHLKYEHIESLESVAKLSENDGVISAWESSFGSVDLKASVTLREGIANPSRSIREPTGTGTGTGTGTKKRKVSPAFDFESAYQLYPRKQGKSKGLAKAKDKIRTEADFQAFLGAMGEMAELWSAATSEQMRFCPHFSTFVSEERWRDEVLPLPGDVNSKSTGQYKHTGDEVYAGGEVKL